MRLWFRVTNCWFMFYSSGFMVYFGVQTKTWSVCTRPLDCPALSENIRISRLVTYIFRVEGVEC